MLHISLNCFTSLSSYFVYIHVIYFIIWLIVHINLVVLLRICRSRARRIHTLFIQIYVYCQMWPNIYSCTTIVCQAKEVALWSCANGTKTIPLKFIVPRRLQNYLTTAMWSYRKLSSCQNYGKKIYIQEINEISNF